MMMLIRRFILCGLLGLFSVTTHADDASIAMVRTGLGFKAAMAVLQESISAHGYKVAHVQKCDGGMAKFNYKTDFYRVVFYGKLDEVRRYSDKYPELIPFLPLKIALFAEDKETVMVSVDPVALSGFFTQPELKTQFQRWSNDLHSILSDVRDAH